MGAVPPCPTSGHAPAPFWGAQGCVGLAQQARGPRSGARQGTRSPSCRPGVSNEWYELPARPLIASSKTLNELLLRRAACARLVAAAAVPAWHPSCHSRCRRGWVLCYLGSVGPEPSVQPPCAGSASWGDPCDPQTLTSSPSCLPEHRTLPCRAVPGGCAAGRVWLALGTSAGSEPKSPSAVCHLHEIYRRGEVGRGLERRLPALSPSAEHLPLLPGSPEQGPRSPLGAPRPLSSSALSAPLAAQPQPREAPA